ncbi:oligosaccharide flippase family protein [Mucilaginibacter lacusdianchii]|uniref:oligosaccharide flippase family protein n=1 Tax=Mucilaginibacter lacusdianchii TaxID=2684211 RepID=UPI00131E0AA6|nr:oligosaccharide flippase family protein [Mucilaginibacter sp. JXJ CY 39]
MKWPRTSKSKYLQSTLVKNSAWGLVANILQILFVSAFFAIVARKYPSGEFARFMISTTVYQIIAAFSSMGLGQWFIRQYLLEDDKVSFTSKFLKTQLGLGLLFYFVNLVLAFIIYQDTQIRTLCFILGTNIIFDNFINAIRTLNIAENEQRKTATILVIDGFLKLLVGCLLFISPFSVIVLSALMIVVRIFTLSLFVKLGSSNSISLKLLWQAQMSYNDLKALVIKNWQFIVIGSISIIYWKIGNIIISKVLTLTNVADYEIAFRIFSVFQILPIVASATIYPQFIKHYNEKNITGLRKLFDNLFLLYTIFAVLSYAFVYTFSGLFVPLVFGNGYPGAISCLQQMFLAFLLLPTVLLQANLIVAIRSERTDMWCNVVSLFVNIAGCFAGLYFVKDLSVINYSVFASFIVFHVLQDILLIRKRLMTISHCLAFYLVLVATIWSCQHFTVYVNPYGFFISFTIIIATLAVSLFLLKKKKIGTINNYKTVIQSE